MPDNEAVTATGLEFRGQESTMQWTHVEQCGLPTVPGDYWVEHVDRRIGLNVIHAILTDGQFYRTNHRGQKVTDMPVENAIAYIKLPAPEI